MKNQAILRSFPRKTPHNSGNAIIICLVIIALMGALTAMLMRSSGRINNNYTTEQLGMMATGLMRTAQGLEGGVSKLVSVNGCGENALDFTNATTIKNYAHTPVSANNDCMLFRSEGAGLPYTSPQTTLLDPAKSAATDFGDWVFLGTHCVIKVGTGDGTSACTKENLELLAIVRYVREDVCLQINRQLKIPDSTTSDLIPVATSDTSSNGFVGTFSVGGSAEIGDSSTGATLVRKATGCFNDSLVSGTYTFYHILLSR